jgi:hypothetical protein
MTVSDNMLNFELGGFHFNMLAEHFKKNPEYEWVMSGDKVSDEFMSSGEVKPEWSTAYFKARNGAEKADIWRYAVLHKYGGVYMDSDMSCHAPYRTFVDPTANITQAMTQKNHGFEASQFALFFTPGHKVLEAVLDDIAGRLGSEKGVGKTRTIELTGPGALARAYALHAKADMPGCGLKLNSGKDHLKSGYGTEHLVFRTGAEFCESPALGKMQLLAKMRDFNTGKVWHKDDVCALKDSKDKFGHWSSASMQDGGTGKTQVHYER